ncbi:MAG: PBP1A family penicillin-binding protein [Longimicrobiales bacterium]
MNRETLLKHLYSVADRVKWPLSPWQTVGAGGAANLLALVLWLNCGVRGCPDVGRLTAYQPDGAPVLLDRNKKQFGNLAPFERRIVSIDSLPDYVANAFVAVEDRRFYKHHGVDWRRSVGAAVVNVKSGGIAQGSSTISMQLARNVFPKELPGQERTFRRKMLEIRVAKAIEHKYTKPEILELYLNHIYFGGGAYGIETAARHYFAKNAKHLKLSEASALAALPKAPAIYDPRRHPERNQQRRSIVLGLMESQGLITTRDAELARNAKLRIPQDAPNDRSDVQLGSYFIDVVRTMLDDKFGEDLYSSRLRILTTLDITAQRAAEEELDRQLRSLSGRVRKGDGPLQGAVVVMEAATGDVFALVGGRNHKQSRYNRAILSQRQVGSAFKPFVYAAAIAKGIPASAIIPDEPLHMEISSGNVWSPQNYDGTFEGAVSVRDALVRSRNIPTINLAREVGFDKVEELAHTAGVRSDIPNQPSMALGAASLTPIELATTYTTFATLGTRAQPRFVLRVEDQDGKVLWEPKTEIHDNAMDPKVAYIVTDMLRDVVNRGTGTGVRAAGFYGAAAGKTGTTNDATDAWFVGYTPELVGDIWIGYDKPSPLGSAATGGQIAAPIWGRMMRRVYAKREPPPVWQVPAGVVQRMIDPGTGLVLEEGCTPEYGEARAEVFLVDHIPESDCPSQSWLGNMLNSVGETLEDLFTRGQRPDTLDPAAGPPGPPPTPPPGAERRKEEMERFLDKRRQQLEKQRQKGNGKGKGRGGK